MHECITNLKSNIKLVKMYLKHTINAVKTVINSHYETVMPEKENVKKLCSFNNWPCSRLSQTQSSALFLCHEGGLTEGKA